MQLSSVKNAQENLLTIYIALKIKNDVSGISSMIKSLKVKRIKIVFRKFRY